MSAPMYSLKTRKIIPMVLEVRIVVSLRGAVTGRGWGSGMILGWGESVTFYFLI